MVGEKIFLIDGNSIMYRSFYAIKLSTNSGFPTGAIFGFISTLKKIIKQYQPNFLAVCFDVSRDTHRRRKYAGYKIQRPPTPDALKMQTPLLKKIIGYHGIKIVQREGFEADDLISSLTLRARQEKYQVVIVSSDKDMYQLIQEQGVVIHNPSNDKVYNYKTFYDKFGFNPQYSIDYLALVGDSVDNIPGAKGIGKVGATKLIGQFKTIENIFANIDKLKPKVKNILEKNRDNIFFSKEMVLLKNDINFDFALDELRIGEPDYENISKIFIDLGFKSLLKDIPHATTKTSLDIVESFDGPVKKLICEGKLFFTGRADYLVVYNQDNSICYKIDNRQKISEILAAPQIKKVTYDFKKMIFDFAIGAVANQEIFDLKIAAYVLNPSLGNYSLKNLIFSFLKIYKPELTVAEEAYFINRLYRFMSQELRDKKLLEPFNIDSRLILILADMEKTGICIDKSKIETLKNKVKEKIEICQNQIYEISKKEFNLNSPKQLSKILFDDLGIPPRKKTKTGYSTGEEVLKELAVDYPIANNILDYRQSNKLLTTYLRPFDKKIGDDKRLHTNFNQTVTQTGRLSSSSPNLQNIPNKDGFSQKIREAFVTSFSDGFLLSADYSQIELRLLAHFANEKKLIEAFNKNIDIHSYTASLLFDLPIAEVDRRSREIAKRVNFGIVYGISPYGLSREIDMSPAQAKVFIDNYFLRYPAVKEFINNTIKRTKELGYVRTFTGRIRYLPEINSKNFETREFASRQAVNTPLQGGAADLIKMAMIKLDEVFKQERLSTKTILQVHDELIFDVPGDELKKVVDITKNTMENIINFKIPIVVNLKKGKNLLYLKEV
jgi:DNA polymerase-1